MVSMCTHHHSRSIGDWMLRCLISHRLCHDVKEITSALFITSLSLFRLLLLLPFSFSFPFPMVNHRISCHSSDLHSSFSRFEPRSPNPEAQTPNTVSTCHVPASIHSLHAKHKSFLMKTIASTEVSNRVWDKNK